MSGSLNASLDGKDDEIMMEGLGQGRPYYNNALPGGSGSAPSQCSQRQKLYVMSAYRRSAFRAASSVFSPTRNSTPAVRFTASL